LQRNLREARRKIHDKRMKKRNFRQRERIPRAFEAIREECLDSESLEFVLLSAQRNPALFENFQEHFLSCEQCSRRVRALAAFTGFWKANSNNRFPPKL
jgi:hypothetical protein